LLVLNIDVPDLSSERPDQELVDLLPSWRSVPLAFVSVHLAQAMWLATIVLRCPLRRISHYAR
jgi:hypothetical protein